MTDRIAAAMSDDTRDVLRICTTCPVLHYDNCPRCFGFGVRSNGAIIAAGQAFDDPPDDAAPCPVCGSTLRGIPH